MNEDRLALCLKEVLKVDHKSKAITPVQTLKLNEKKCKIAAVNLQSLSGMLSPNNRYKSVISHANSEKHMEIKFFPGIVRSSFIFRYVVINNISIKALGSNKIMLITLTALFKVLYQFLALLPPENLQTATPSGSRK